MRYVFAFFMVMFGFVSQVFAFDFNPTHWLSGGGYVVVVTLIGWIFKVQIDKNRLKDAVSSIKIVIDDVRKANDGNSPGGNKIVLDEAQTIAKDSLSSILSVLRALPSKWIPHWVQGM